MLLSEALDSVCKDADAPIRMAGVCAHSEAGVIQRMDLTPKRAVIQVQSSLLLQILFSLPPTTVLTRVTLTRKMRLDLRQAVKLEPYSGDNAGLLVAVEAVFLILVGAQVGVLLISATEEWEKGRDAFKGFLVSVWTMLDLVNLSLLLWSICVRYSLLHYLVTHQQQIFSPDFEEIFQRAAAVQDRNLFVNGLNIILCLMRFFSFYRFQVLFAPH